VKTVRFRRNRDAGFLAGGVGLLCFCLSRAP